MKLTSGNSQLPQCEQLVVALAIAPRSMRVRWSNALVAAATGVEPLACPIVYCSVEALGRLPSTRALTAQ